MALELEPKKGPFSRERNTGGPTPEGSPKVAIFDAFHHHGDCKMAMLPQLFSLSGLAVELGMDRRTVAAKLRNVRPDGNLPGGTPGWRLNTALRALDGPRFASSRSGEFDLIADLLEGRLADPAIVTEGDRILLTVGEAAQMLETDCETVLLWLRTGAPYSTRGDWSNGAGFIIDLSWLVNWLLLIGAHLALMDNRHLHDALRLPG